MKKFVPSSFLSRNVSKNLFSFVFFLTAFCFATNANAQTSTINYTGTIVTYTVPDGVTKISIESFGAQGGNSLGLTAWFKSGGLGARMKGDFAVTPGQKLKILVGGKGGDGNEMGGGGGGTFVTDFQNNPICIAGAGGGSSWGVYDDILGYANGTTEFSGKPGLFMPNPWFTTNAGAGGVSGNGGGVDGLANGNNNEGSGGGGLIGDGMDAIEHYAGFPHSTGGASFINGGAGGKSTNANSADGGFGGGGASDANPAWQWGAGGGGGYSGGGGGSFYGCGGGGGSFNSGANQDNTGGVNAGDGKVVITILEKAPVGKAPVIVAPDNITVNNDLGRNGAVVNFTASETTGIPASVIDYSIPSGSFFKIGTTSITATATNENGTSSASFTVTVIDNERPFITAPADASSECDAIQPLQTPTVTDNSDVAPTVTMVETRTDGIGNYIITRTWTATDASGNTATAKQLITVSDTKAPTLINVPANANADCSNIPEAPAVTATDICDPSPVISFNETITNGTGIKNYSITRTWTATDASGNASSKTQIITVKDSKAPVPDIAILPAVVTNGITTIVAPTATDNCAGVITGVLVNATNYYKPGTYTVTWKYDDLSGNISTQTQKVTFKDLYPPVPVVLNLPDLTAECGLTVTTQPTALDFKGVPVVGTTYNALTYSRQGIFTINWNYTDKYGNKSTQAQKVIIKDITLPVPTIAELPIITGQCSATLKTNVQDVLVLIPPTATDNCAGLLKGTTRDPLTYSKQGTFIVNWTYTDAAGNKTVQKQTVIIKDDQAPVPLVAELPTITGECSARVNMNYDGNNDKDDDPKYGSPVPYAMDNCSGLIKGKTTDPIVYSGEGTYTIHWNFDDKHGNISRQEQLVVINDITAPVPYLAQLPTIKGRCSVTVTGVPLAKDNCRGWIKGKTTDPLVYTAEGTYTINWNFDDGNGNISTQTQTVIVHDDIKPVIKVPANIVLNCGAITSPAITGTATATDNCVGPIDISFTDAVNGNITTRTWKATDVAGNSSSANQIISQGSLFTVNLKAVPNSSVFTAGISTNLFLGYGAQAATLQMTSLPNVGAPYTYVWEGLGKSQLSSTSIASPVFKPTVAGVQTFSVTVTNKYGCVSTASISICVTDVRAASNKITICHAGSNGAPSQTLTVSAAEVASHLLTHPGDRLGSCNQSPCNSNNIYSVHPIANPIEMQTKNMIAESSAVVEDLSVLVMPNPSATYFTLKISSKNLAPVNMRVVDAAGRVIEAKQQLAPNSTLQIGHSYGSGIYIVEMIQGNTRKAVQLIKARG
jgi:hypothetical protein